MDTVLRLAGLLVLVGGIVAEAARTIPAAGLALVLGVSLAIYLWFLAIARRRLSPSPTRRRR
jgi:hypothetical protein